MNADLKVCLHDILYILNRNLLIPGGPEGHGDGTGDGEIMALCQIHAGGKSRHTLRRCPVQIGQIMGNAGRYIQLDLPAAAGDGALHTLKVRNQGPVFHAFLLFNHPEHFIRIGHLGNRLRAHEASHLNHRESRIRHTVNQIRLVLGGNQGFLILQSVPDTNFTNTYFLNKIQ